MRTLQQGRPSGSAAVARKAAPIYEAFQRARLPTRTLVNESAPHVTMCAPVVSYVSSHTPPMCATDADLRRGMVPVRGARFVRKRAAVCGRSSTPREGAGALRRLGAGAAGGSAAQWSGAAARRGVAAAQRAAVVRWWLGERPRNENLAPLARSTSTSHVCLLLLLLPASSASVRVRGFVLLQLHAGCGLAASKLRERLLALSKVGG